MSHQTCRQSLIYFTAILVPGGELRYTPSRPGLHKATDLGRLARASSSPSVVALHCNSSASREVGESQLMAPVDPFALQF